MKDIYETSLILKFIKENKVKTLLLCALIYFSSYSLLKFFLKSYDATYMLSVHYIVVWLVAFVILLVILSITDKENKRTFGVYTFYFFSILLSCFLYAILFLKLMVQLIFSVG